jgi:peptidyl-prolyl cis-trans isomerase C
MSKHHRLALSLALFAAVSIGSASFAMAAEQTIADLLNQPPPTNTVVARVNGVDIHRSEVIEQLRGLPAQVRQIPLDQFIKVYYPRLIAQMVNDKLLVAAGRADKLADDKDVKAKVALYQDHAIEEVYVSRAVKAKITDKALHDRFEQMLKENPPQDEVHARHILVATEAEAKDIIAQLDKGAKFDALAKAKSSDSSAKDGGDLGFFTRGDMVPEFADVAFNLKPGEYSKVPVKTQFGYHVIKVEERRQSKAPTFEESKEQLTQEMSEKVTETLVNDLKAKAKIETFTLDGKPMPAAAPQ